MSTTTRSDTASSDASVLESLLAPDPVETEPDDSDGTLPPAPGEEQGEQDRRRKKLIAWLVIAALVIVGALFVWYLLNRKPLTALPGVGGDRAPTYSYSLYDLTQPLGVAVTADGARIYVTEGGKALDVKILGRDGAKLGTLALPKGAGMPMYVAVDPDGGTVFVTDRLSKQIYAFSPDGAYLRTVKVTGDLGKPRFAPLGIAVGPDHNLYVTDVRGEDATQHRVVVLDPDGRLVRTMGRPGELSYPNGIVVDQDGIVRVTDSNNGRMVTYGTDGRVLSTISRGIGEGDLGLPRGIGIDDAKHIFVVDTTDHMVRVYRAADDAAKPPAFVANFGDEGRADGAFEFPNGLATDTRARIYVTDRENGRLQVWGY